jgi:hypothetical protein
LQNLCLRAVTAKSDAHNKFCCVPFEANYIAVSFGIQQLKAVSYILMLVVLYCIYPKPSRNENPLSHAA